VERRGKGGEGKEKRSEKEKKQQVVLVRRNDDAGRVELLAATQVDRSGLQACLISSRAIVLEPNIIFPSQLPFPLSRSIARDSGRVNLILIMLLYLMKHDCSFFFCFVYAFKCKAINY